MFRFVLQLVATLAVTFLVPFDFMYTQYLVVLICFSFLNIITAGSIWNTLRCFPPTACILVLLGCPVFVTAEWYVTLVLAWFTSSFIVDTAPFESESTTVDSFEYLPSPSSAKSRVNKLTYWFHDIWQPLFQSLRFMPNCLMFVIMWASVVVVPLDWNQQWQRFPLPLIYGAMVGNIFKLLFIILGRRSTISLNSSGADDKDK